MNNSLLYKGRVKLDVMKHGRRIQSSIHNTGLPDMSWLFAKALTGNLNQSTDVPRLLDVGYIIPGTGGIWTSILNKPVNIGGRQYSYDATLSNWVGTLISTLYYSDLNGGILDTVVQRATNNEIQLKMRLCSYQVANRKYFAEIDITPEEITKIKDMTSVIITWYSEIVPDATETANAGTIEPSPSTEETNATSSETEPTGE